MKTRKRLGGLLIEAGLITNEQLNEALEEKSLSEKLGDALVSRGFITELQLIEVLEFQLGIPHVQLYHYPVDEQALAFVTKETAQSKLIIPLKIQDNVLTIAMSDPMDYYTIEDLEMSTGYMMSPVIAAKDDILYAINKHYFSEEDQTSELEATDEAPVVRVLDQLLQTGVQLKASDLHIDPQETDVAIRYRIDGRLQTEKHIPKSMQQSLIARIKILANLNITESRLPQDGRIKTLIGLSPVDLRISSLPTVFGEKIVVRILDLNNALLELSELYFSKDNYQKYLKLINLPSGLILLTGPTGSGKTSTLYASINKLNSENVNIITVEDPVEFELPGINQVEVNSAVGLDFAAGLRSILRQDPNIIMVGEIRDQETAEIAVRASLTGHLVFSTLHTNSAIGAVPRLIDMGIEPYLVVSSVSGIVAQRLVRRICRDCRTERELTEMEMEVFSKHNIDIDHVYYGEGCSSCQQRGYRGRLAIHELIVIDDVIRDLLLNNQSLDKVRKYAGENGTTFLIEDGLEKIKLGLTTMEEILQVSISG